MTDGSASNGPVTYPARLRLRAEVWGTPMDRYVLENPVVRIGNVVVDARALFDTRSTCEMCSRSCTWGTNISSDVAAKLSPLLDGIRERYIPAGRRDKAGWHWSDYWRQNVTHIVTLENGHDGCGFLYNRQGRYLCAIYSWAADNGLDPFDLWPFDCILYPIAIQPYKGILHPGCDLLTLSLPHNRHLIDVYSSPPEHESVYDIVRRELVARIKAKLRSLPFVPSRPERNPKPEPHFRERDGWVKPYSYRYYGRNLRWYFGDAFHAELAAQGDAWHAARSGDDRGAGDAPPTAMQSPSGEEARE